MISAREMLVGMVAAAAAVTVTEMSQDHESWAMMAVVMAMVMSIVMTMMMTAMAMVTSIITAT